MVGGGDNSGDGGSDDGDRDDDDGVDSDDVVMIVINLRTSKVVRIK